MIRYLSPSQGVGDRQPNLDLDQAADALVELGYFQKLAWLGNAAMTALSPDFADSLRKFQRDEGLEVDGFALPDGETVKALNDRLTGKPRGYAMLEHGTRQIERPVGDGLESRDDDVKLMRMKLAALQDLPDRPGDDHSPFVDRTFDDAVKSFQRRNGLRETGSVHPRDTTERTIDEQIDALARAKRPEWEDYHVRMAELRGGQPGNRKALPDFDQDGDGYSLAGLPPSVGGKQRPPRTPPLPNAPSPPPLQWPQLPKLPSLGDIPMPPIIGLPPTWQSPDSSRQAPAPDAQQDDSSASHPREPAYPSTPDTTKQLWQTYGESFHLIDLTDLQTIDNIILENSRGGPKTQDQLHEINMEIQRIASNHGCGPFNHTAGGRTEKEGKTVKEKLLRDPSNPNEASTKGGVRADLQYELKRPDRSVRKLAVQQQDIKAGGVPTDREARNAIRVLTNGGRNFFVVTFPKLLDHLTVNWAAFETLIRSVLDEMCRDTNDPDDQNRRKFEFKDFDRGRR